MHHLIEQLRKIDGEFPSQRKLLLVPSINFGRELLASLARVQGSWIGWEPATLASLAGQFSVVELARRKRRRASDVTVANLASQAFDDAIAAGDVETVLASLGWSAGTRNAITDALLELRASGVNGAMMSALCTDHLQLSIARVLERYETRLSRAGRADATEVIRAAIRSFDNEAPFQLDYTVMVAVPGAAARGVARELYDKLVARGLVRLKSPTPHAPAAEMFCAGTPADELREIVRRILASGRPLDDAEIACTNRDLYGITLNSLCRQLDISATILDGIPLAATRLGRAVERWLSWLESGYHADILREGMESGDLTGILREGLESGDLAGADDTDPDRPTPTQLASELRRLRIGWGLQATAAAPAKLRSASWHARTRQFDEESDGDFAVRRNAHARVAAALAELLAALVSIAATTEVGSSAPTPARGFGNDSGTTSVAKLALSTIAFLNYVPARGAAERATRQRLVERLQEIGAEPGAATDMLNAGATLRQHLSDLRAWTETSNTAKPRRATGGHVHLTSIEHAGATGRPLLFYVGLDADNTTGPVISSPLLPDALRVRLNERGADLPTTEQRRRERASQLAMSLISSDSTLTLSYAMRGAPDNRESIASQALLGAARATQGNDRLSHAALRAQLAPPVSAVPAPNASAADARDVWLQAMSDGALLLDAKVSLREAFPALDRGLIAQTTRGDLSPNSYHGLVPAAGLLDPRAIGRPISPSSLERLATCGLNWFYGVALGAREPDDPVYDALVWLNALDRGIALHSIYERAIRTGVHKQRAGVERSVLVERIVHDVANNLARDVPAPSDIVRARETSALLNEAEFFVASEHDAYEREPWEVAALESQFGGDAAPAFVPLDDGTLLQVRGRVDRVDRLRDGSLRLVDYKTGRAFEWKAKRGTFDGGRKLQLALYSPAISKQLEAVVAVAEYRFVTVKGDGAIATANAEMLAAAPGIVRSLLDDVAAGRFLPTMDKADCAYCEFAVICRVNRDVYSHESPRADWARSIGAVSEHFEGMRNRRGGNGNDE